MARPQARRAAPGSVIAEPENNVYGEKYKVLRTTDGRFVVHEMGQRHGTFRFGPSFKTEIEARWRAYFRAVGESVTGLRLGEMTTTRGLAAEVVDFARGQMAVRLVRSGMVEWVEFANV
jgi:hypothetical protein